MLNNKLYEKIISFIADNKMDTAQITDCMGKVNGFAFCKPIKTPMFAVGKVEYIYGHSDTNWPIHEQVRNINEQCILFVDSINTTERAVFGELVSSYVFNQKKCIAIVTNGYMRDLDALLEKEFKIWCKGITPLGFYNVKRDETPEIIKIAEQHRAFLQDAIAVCDSSGVAIIPKEQITEEFYQKLCFMKKQEAKWHECVDEFGWDTFNTVCLKLYNK